MGSSVPNATWVAGLLEREQALEEKALALESEKAGKILSFFRRLADPDPPDLSAVRQIGGLAYRAKRRRRTLTFGR
jgi:hypothetical protein